MRRKYQFQSQKPTKYRQKSKGSIALRATAAFCALFIALTATIHMQAAGPNYQSKVLGPGGGGGIFNPLINPLNADNFIMSTDMSGTFVTTDGGQSFSQKNVMGTAKYAFHPHDKNTVYAYNNHLYISKDSGKNFSLLYPKSENIRQMVSGYGEGVSFDYYDNSKRPRNTILSLEVDPEDPNLIYFVTKYAYNGKEYTQACIQKSTDGGQTWTILAEFEGKMFSLIRPNSSDAYVTLQIDPTTPVEARALNVISSEGIFRVEPDGKISKISDKTSRAGDVYYDKTTQETAIYIIEPVENSSQFLNQIIKSVDGGRTWNPVSTGFYEKGVRSFYDVAVNGDRIYASFNTTDGANNPYLDYGVGVSTDGGKTWTHSLKGWDVSNITEHSWLEHMDGGKGNLGWSGVKIHLSVSKSNPNIAINSNYGNAYITKDGGKTWQDTNSNFDPDTKLSSSKGVDQVTGWDVDIDPFDPNHMFFSYTDIGLFESKDGGKTWKRHQNNGIPVQPYYSNTAYAFEFDPEIEGFYVAGFGGLHDLNRGYFIRRIINMADKAKEDPNQIYGGYTGGVVRTTDGGKTWTHTGKLGEIQLRDEGVSGLPDHAIVTDVVIDPNSPKDPNRRVVYAACMGFGVYRSEDGGQTFKKFISGMEDAKYQLPFRLRFTPDYSRLYVLFAPSNLGAQDIDWHPDDGPVYYLETGEKSWKKLASMPSEGMPANHKGHDYVAAFNGIASDRKGNIYGAGRANSSGGTALGSNYGGVWLSQDDGSSWKNIYPPTVNVLDVKVDSRNDNILYICNNLGGQVLVSYKGVDTTANDWHILQGFEFMVPLRVIEDTNHPSYVYVTTFGGGTWHLKLPYPVDTTYEAADYTRVNEALAKVPNDLSIYTENSASVLKQAMDEVIWGKDKSEQAIVDGYADALEKAIEELVLKGQEEPAVPADYTAVDAAIDRIPDDLSVYTDESILPLTDALQKVIRGKDISEQAVVDGYADAIQNAIDGLILRPENNMADYTEVDIAIARVPADCSIYTDESKAVLQQALDAVVRDLPAEDQHVVDGFAKAISDAIDTLVLRPDAETADYRCVASALSKIPKDLVLYTDDSKAALEHAVAAIVWNLPPEQQAEVDAFASDIEDAITQLVLKPVENPADYRRVHTAMRKVPANLSFYTDASIAPLEAAINAVVWELPDTKQDTVDGYAQAIEDAVAALVLKHSRVVVQFQSNGGSMKNSQVIPMGGKAQFPGYSSRSGYNFTGWYGDMDCTIKFDFETIIMSNKTIYAGWTPVDNSGGDTGSGGEDDNGNGNNPGAGDDNDNGNGNTTIPEDGGNHGGNGDSTSPGGGDNNNGNQTGTGDNENNGEKPWDNPFADVSIGDWFYNDVAYTTKNGLFLGTSPVTFSPYASMDRGMLVTVLGRLSGESIPSSGFDMPFADVDVNGYAAPYIAWAAKHDIIRGFAADRFGPNENLTREQIAEILFRYAVYKEKAPVNGMQEKLNYPDTGRISDWAKNGAMYCQKYEIIQGKENGVFDPQGTAIRAEVSAMLHRFAENVK